MMFNLAAKSILRRCKGEACVKLQFGGAVAWLFLEAQTQDSVAVTAFTFALPENTYPLQPRGAITLPSTTREGLSRVKYLTSSPTPNDHENQTTLSRTASRMIANTSRKPLPVRNALFVLYRHATLRYRFGLFHQGSLKALKVQCLGC